MFIPSFVIALFIYSYFDVYVSNQDLSCFFQKINGKIYLNVNWKNNKPFSFLNIVFKSKDNYSVLTPNSNLIIKSPSQDGAYFVSLQGRLDIFRKIIKLSRRPEETIKDRLDTLLSQSKDIYFHLRPYRVGDSTLRIDPIQTIKRNQIYIREVIEDIIRAPKIRGIKKIINIFVRSNRYIKKREDLNKGPFFEWALISLALIGSYLEWGNIIFTLIAFLSIGVVYYILNYSKWQLKGRKAMNKWIMLLFSVFILESIFSLNVIEAGIHFLLLLCIYKHLFQRERRDAFTYMFLVLFVFVALSFFTLKIWFIIFFLLYLLFSIALISIYAGGEKENEYETSFGLPKTKKSYAFMNITVIIVMTSLFFLLPHGERVQTSSKFNIFRQDVKTGFSDEVNLSQILTIKKDYSKQFLIENVNATDTAKFQNLYFRGMRFTDFKNMSWTREQTTDVNYIPPRSKPSDMETWTFKYYPNNYTTIFLPKTPILVFGDYFTQMVEDRSLVKFKNRILKATDIKVTFKLNQFGEIVDATTYHDYKIPKISKDMEILFTPYWTVIPENITKNPKLLTDYVESKSGFKYSLDKPARDLTSFLYDEKQGHCEYFATVLALTLQHYGFKATMVNGFMGGEYNDLSRTWVIRGENAHSWVEILQDNGEWQVLDATPHVETKFWFKDSAILSDLITYYDLIEYNWYTYIVQFNISNQRTLWLYLLNKVPITILLSSCIILVFILLQLNNNYLIPYLQMSAKEKFLYWLSNKTNFRYFILDNLKTKYPALVHKTRELIYRNEYTRRDIDELKSKWKEAIKL